MKKNKDIAMTFDFIRYLIDNPEIIDLIPNKSEITFVENGKSPESISIKKKKQLQVRVKNVFDI